MFMGKKMFGPFQSCLNLHDAEALVFGLKNLGLWNWAYADLHGPLKRDTLW